VTELGCGLIDDRDTTRCLNALTDPDGQPLSERGIAGWIDGEATAELDPDRLRLEGLRQTVLRLRAQDMPSHFGFVRTPLPAG
jgi:hypothetical protein